MTGGSRARFASVVREAEIDLGLACLLIGAETHPDLDVDAALRLLDQLAEDVAPAVAQARSADEVAAALGTALGARAGFRGGEEDYGDLRSSLLHEVLRRRRGLPILLSVVYVEVGRRVGRQVLPIGLPGHFVVGVPEAPDGPPVLLDPFAGGVVCSRDDVLRRVRAVTGDAAYTDEAALAPWDPGAVLGRVLANIRGHSTSADTLRTRLWATELALLLPSHPLALRRERAETLARLGDFLGAATELAGFAEAVGDADPAAAERAQREARLVLSRLS